MRRAYCFHQNNSGGNFEKGIYNVYVEAETVEEAREAFQSRSGFKFCKDYSGCSCCSCCGHRWTDFAFKEDLDDPDLISMPYIFNDAPHYLILYADGTAEKGNMKEKPYSG